MGAFTRPLWQWKSKKVYIFVCVSVSLVIEGAVAHALHCIAIYVLSVSTITFPHYLLSARICEKTLLDIKCVLISTQLFSEIFLSLKRIKLNIITMYSPVCMFSGGYFVGQILMKIELSPHIFAKYYQISWNSVYWEKSFCKQTDRLSSRS